MPPNANATTKSAVAIPAKPLGAKPSPTKLDRPGDCTPGSQPKSSAKPTRRNPTIAATGTLDRVLAGGHDLVVVGGGDGTVSYAAGRVAGTNVILGVLPLGTANDFARTMEIPNNLAEACATVAGGKVVDIDLGQANGAPFLNVASVGLSVAVTEALSLRLKRYIGPLAYSIVTLTAYARHKPFRARHEFPEGDQEPLELDDLLQVAVGNGRHYGGGNTVSPTAGMPPCRRRWQPPESCG